MKRYIYRLSILFAVALFVGCQTDGTSEVGSGSSLTISLDQVSRLSLGDKRGDSYPVYWSEGDRIGVNGESSDVAQISANNPSVATFTLGENVQYPYCITYPYSEATSAASPKVVFLAEQNYIDGSFDAGAVPMCGYAEQGGGVALQHLAAILRLSLKSVEENTVLDRIVITSSATKLAGEFEVNCQNGAISPSASATNVVTYSVNQPLSTTEAKAFYISLPAVNVGECKVEFFDAAGGKMTANWNDRELRAGAVREFSTISYGVNTSCTLSDFDSEDDVFIDYFVSGCVKDTNGNPIEGVAVSDGFTVVTTDSNGFYHMAASSDAWYIYISVPSEYEVPINEYGQPCFYKKYERNTKRYHFTLTPLAGGKESKFALFAFGDPQVSSDTQLNRFKNESIPAVKAHYEKVTREKGVPCYGITLGDLISNNTISSNYDEEYRDDMRDGFAVSKVGFPVFHVIGNHDNGYYDEENPISADARNSTYQLVPQRAYEDMFGPVNYSFNRGDVHIISMRTTLYTSTITSSVYELGFMASQYRWLEQDLSLVPKDKIVILCVHIPLYNNSDNNVREVLSLLNTYDEAHVISGHTHTMRNFEHKENNSNHSNVYEHNSAAMCGAWWCSNMCGDGTPNGYQVFYFDGNKCVNWYYIGCNNGMDTEAHQMRLYRGNAVTGGEISGTNPYGIKGYYGFSYNADVLLANIYNADTKWSIKVYEDGVYTGNMSLIAYKNPSFSSLTGDYTMENPRRSASNSNSSHDMYVAGLHLGILGRHGADGPSSGSWSGCYNMYKYVLKNKDAKEVKVEATDRFGNVYTETKITEGTDYTLTKKP